MKPNDGESHFLFGFSFLFPQQAKPYFSSRPGSNHSSQEVCQPGLPRQDLRGGIFCEGAGLGLGSLQTVWVSFPVFDFGGSKKHFSPPLT